MEWVGGCRRCFEQERGLIFVMMMNSRFLGIYKAMCSIFEKRSTSTSGSLEYIAVNIINCASQNVSMDSDISTWKLLDQSEIKVPTSIQMQLNQNYGFAKLIDDTGFVRTLNPSNEASSDTSS
jgi:hypothetical protein